MTETINLGLPYLEAGQAQKHVTHNEALRILDAAIHMSAVAISSSPPGSPEESERHIVAEGATGAFASHDNTVATFQDGAWQFLAPRTGWRAWVEAAEILFVFDGEAWRDLRDLSVSLDDVTRIGINTLSEGDNRLAVRSNAAVMSAITGADGGSGDARLQISKEAEINTASVFFSNDFEGRAEFGLVGGDDFKLKVSADGEDWVESLVVDPANGSVSFARALALEGEISPPEIGADQNDYAPSGLAGASVLRLSADASRALTGLAGGTAGRVVIVQNIGGNALQLRDENAASSAANRFALGTDITLGANQCALLQYDDGASRWRAVAAPGASAAGGGSADQELFDAQSMLALADALNVAQFSGESGNRVGDSFDALTYVDVAGAANLDTSTAGVLKPALSGSQLYTNTGGQGDRTGLGWTLSTGITWSGTFASHLIDGTTSSQLYPNPDSQSVTGVVIWSLDMGSGNAKVIAELKILSSAGGSNAGTHKIQGSNNGSAWTDVSSAFAFDQSVATNTVTLNLVNNTAYRYYRMIGVSGTIRYYQINELQFKIGDPSSIANMTVRSAAFTAASAPSAVRVVLRAKFVDEITVNTDLTVEVSRDNGTTWSAGTLTDRFTTPGSAHHVLDTGDISVSAQPSGTSVRWRVKSQNNKSLEINDAYLRWS
ncbi:MAG: DUF2793 domain-containing protein [Xanthobacteraceae bacterium]|nr:DUF2793 domain-containing protein [Xanthobacteraceae bacterium]